MPTTDWVIGSHESVPVQTFDLTSNSNTENMTLPAGSRYLWDSDSSFDLLRIFQTEINTHNDINDCEVFLGRDRMVHANAGVTFSITWTGTDNTARNMMGFSGSLSLSQTHEANTLSTFLWSPGKEGSPDAPLGTLGHPVYDSQYGMSGTGVVRRVRHNTYRKNTYLWRNVDRSRVHTTSESAGEYFTFFDNVIEPARKFGILREVNEDLTSNAAATVSGDWLGPYVVSQPGSPMTNAAQRDLKNVDERNRVRISMNSVPEYT